MYERSLGERSGWSEYLRTLPAQEPLPVTWAEPQLALLRGTAIPPSVAADRERLRKDWERHVRPLSEAQPSRFPASHFSYDCYVAARTLTASRAFAVDAYHGEGMVPLADLFNHSPDEHVRSEELV
jgi:SET domain-containing protein 6